MFFFLNQSTFLHHLNIHLLHKETRAGLEHDGDD